MDINIIKPVAYIYVITNIISGKKYIGQTIRDPKVRFKEHIASSKDDDPGCRAIALAIKSYGVKVFQFNILHECKPDELDRLETEEIEKQNTMASNGYNLYPGGKGTYKGHNGSARDKISAGQRKHFDGIHDLPRYMQYVPSGGHGEGYAVSIPNIPFAHFTASVLSLDEKFDFAVKYLTTDNRDSIHAEYKALKNERRVDKIAKTVTIDNRTFILPSYFMWCPGEKMFLIRKPGKKTKQFGDKRISIQANYDRAYKYYNDD
jgi:GIY-YIG catalytic domain